MHSTESLCEVSPLKSGNGSIWHLLKNIYSNYSNSTRKVSPNKLLLSEYYLNAPVCDLHKFFLCFPDKKSQHNRHNSQEDNGWFCLCLKACQIQKKKTIVDAPSVYRQILCPVFVSFSSL